MLGLLRKDGMQENFLNAPGVLVVRVARKCNSVVGVGAGWWVVMGLPWP